jgi:hypothetical protein
MFAAKLRQVTSFAGPHMAERAEATATSRTVEDRMRTALRLAIMLASAAIAFLVTVKSKVG